MCMVEGEQDGELKWQCAAADWQAGAHSICLNFQQTVIADTYLNLY